MEDLNPGPESPYKFLDYYTERDEDIFFGRKRETRILLSDIVVNRLVVLFARTGTGKTSLINAGVVPRLKEKGYDTFFIRVRKDPVKSLETEIKQHPARLCWEGDTLAEQLENVVRQLRKPIVLFFDQFEEFFIYTLKDKDYPERSRDFVANIATIYQNHDSRVHFVFSMREEWFVEMDIFRDEIPTIFHNESNLRLRWFDAAQAHEAIKYPAEVCGVEIKDEVITKLFADLAINDAVEPAQLQIVCDTLWRETQGESITLDDYQKLGKPGSQHNIALQLLYRRLEEEFEQIETEEQLELLARLLPELRTDYKTKYVRDVMGLSKQLETDESSLNELIERLEKSRLLRRGVRDELQVIELAHDYLVEHLDELCDRVKAVWPLRMIKAALNIYRVGGELMLDEQLAKLSEIVEKRDVRSLTFDQEQATFLFRSAFAHGMYRDLWFDEASRRGVPIREVLEAEFNQEGSDLAYNAMDFLVRLLSDKIYIGAAELLEKALGKEWLATDTLHALGRCETSEAVGLLKLALKQERLTAPAQEALEWLARSRKNTQVARQAQDVLSDFASSQVIPPSPKKETRTERGPQETTEEKRSVPEPSAPHYSPEILPPAKNLEGHYPRVINALLSGRLVPFLGTGVNLYGRPANVSWQPGSQYLPSDSELSDYLAAKFRYPGSGRHDLRQVSQYITTLEGSRSLYSELRQLFTTDYPISPLHRFFAALPGFLRAKGSSPSHLLVVTTCYDDVMERAFKEAGEPFDLVAYEAEGQEPGDRFRHWLPDGEARLIEKPNEYLGLSLDERSVILKLHGAIDRANSARDSFVITEDHYIDYWARTDLSALMPVMLIAKLLRSHYLFMGYGLHDWNARVILHRIWGRQQLRYKSWAIQSAPQRIEHQLWSQRDVEVFNVAPDDYIAELSRYMQEGVKE